jgi:hypothetical protein
MHFCANLANAEKIAKNCARINFITQLQVLHYVFMYDLQNICVPKNSREKQSLTLC